MIPIRGVDGQDAFTPLTGGAILNTSIALGRLEVPVGILSGVSNDLFGAQLVDQLHTSQVSTDLLIRSDRPTTLAFVKLTKGQAQYTFYDENSAARMLARDDIPDLPLMPAHCISAASACATRPPPTPIGRWPNTKQSVAPSWSIPTSAPDSSRTVRDIAPGCGGCWPWRTW